MAESEWPLFFTYLILEALFRGDIATADAYFAKLFKTLVPELYYVPSNLVDAEKANEHSQIRYARRAATSG